MKVQQIIFKNHPVFSAESTATFFEADAQKIPKVFFVVGNNGSGKTQLLESIFYGLTLPTNNQSVGQGRAGQADFYILNNTKVVSVSNMQGDSFNIDLSKIYYADLVGNRHIPPIPSSTINPLSLDKPVIQEKSGYTPDVDQVLISVYYEDLLKKENKLDRFINAFGKFFGGSLVFKEVDRTGQYHKIIFTDKNGKDILINDLSTGEKEILLRIGHILKNFGTLDGSVILIDEPETSLHPKWQQKYIQSLLEIFDGVDVQFIIATHSPYILKGMKEGESVCFKLDKNREGDEKLEKVGSYPKSFKNPSINLINYIVYAVWDELLFLELFVAYEVYKKMKLPILEEFFLEQTDMEKETFIATEKWGNYNRGDSVIESLPMYLRNAIHHPTERARSYDDIKIQKGIEILLSLLEK